MLTLKKIAENHGLTKEGVDYALRQYQIIISEITHGMLSKLSYDAHDVLRYAQERWCDTCELQEDPDRVRVVRCRDCKHSKRMCQPWNDLICDKHGGVNMPDWYCADWERKE